MIWGFFKVITPFIDVNTREKLKFNEDMSRHVPRAQLLKQNGGDVEFEYDHSVYWPTLVKVAEARRAEYRARWEHGGKRIGEHEGYLRGGSEKSLAETIDPPTYEKGKHARHTDASLQGTDRRTSQSVEVVA